MNEASAPAHRAASFRARTVGLLLLGIAACEAELDHQVAAESPLEQVARSANESIEILEINRTGRCASAAWRVVESANDRLVLELDGYRISPEKLGDFADDCAVSIKVAGKAAKSFKAQVLAPLVGLDTGGGRFGGQGPVERWTTSAASASEGYVSACGTEQELQVRSRYTGTLEGAGGSFRVGEMRVVLSALACREDGVIEAAPVPRVEVPADSGLTIKSVRVVGSACSEGAKVTLSPNQRNFEIGFANLALMNERFRSVDCFLAVDALVPAGYEAALESYLARATSSLKEGMSAEFSVESGDLWYIKRTRLTGPQESVELSGQFTPSERTFPGCGHQPHEISIALNSLVRNAPDQGTGRVDITNFGPVKFDVRPCAARP